jgi:hemerythrin-like domain-containing protein/FMN phosphatase YigB (HAD superfamily)
MTTTKPKAVFFDVRDTLGTVDRAGHMVLFKPSTERLLSTVQQVHGLRIGIITNLPKNVTSAMGRAMLEEAGILPYLDPKGLVINHDVGSDKPGPEIFEKAAAQMGLSAEQCMFVGENFLEILGAQTAGMRAVLKPCPPGREFLLKPSSVRTTSETFSGRLSEVLMEEDHLIGKRIVICAANIAKRLESQEAPPLEAMGLLVYLVNAFIDPFHHGKEEKVLMPLAFARGFPEADAAWVYLEHDQGRALFRGMDVALKRLRLGDGLAADSFQHCAQAFINLYKAHGKKEDDLLLPAMGRFLGDMDDAIIVELMAKVGPEDIVPWIALISEMEGLLDVTPS